VVFGNRSRVSRKSRASHFVAAIALLTVLKIRFSVSVLQWFLLSSLRSASDYSGSDAVLKVEATQAAFSPPSRHRTLSPAVYKGRRPKRSDDVGLHRCMLGLCFFRRQHVAPTTWKIDNRMFDLPRIQVPQRFN